MMRLLALLLVASCASAPPAAKRPPEVEPAAAALRASLLFHASFDGRHDADRAAGDGTLYTAVGGKWMDAKPGLLQQGASLVDDGRFGGALQFGVRSKEYVFFRGAKNLAYDPASFAGTISVWLKADPTGAMGPGFADPLEITDKKWSDACLSLDWDKEGDPRAFRFGVYPDYATWNPMDTPWDNVPDDARPWVAVKHPPFVRDRWVHVAMTWERFNTGSSDAVAKLYLDGVFQGERRGVHRYSWTPEKVRINVGKVYVGAMDDLAIFDRALSEQEIAMVRDLPQGAGGLGGGAP